jgi:hypothetical protein
MSFQGRLATVDFAGLLSLLANLGKTGRLTVRHGDDERTVYFQDGEIVRAQSSDPGHRLGRILLRRKLLSEPQLDEANVLQVQTGKTFGSTLVDLGYLNENQLEEALYDQADEVVQTAFLWPDGEFRYQDAEPPEGDLVRIVVRAQGAILEGIRRRDEWRVIRERIPDDSVVFRTLDEPEFKITLTPDEWRVLRLIDGKRTVEQIADESSTPRFDTIRSLHSLLRAGVIVEVAKDTLVPDGESPFGGTRPPAEARQVLNELLRLTQRALKRPARGLIDREISKTGKTVPELTLEDLLEVSNGIVRAASLVLSEVQLKLFRRALRDRVREMLAPPPQRARR